jgi:hypothetical protein
MVGDPADASRAAKSESGRNNLLGVGDAQWLDGGAPVKASDSNAALAPVGTLNGTAND